MELMEKIIMFTSDGAKHLAVILQTELMDLIAAHKEICLTSTLIKEAIDETKFNELYAKSKSMADDMGITVSFPNREKRLRKDNLNDQSSVKTYYKEKVHDAYLLKILAELENRFSNDQLVAFKFQYFLPDNAASLSYDAISEALMKYEKFFNEAKEKCVLEPELRRWQG
uniref:Uncharacterized protein n=1 Tax=Romanomermis culicivorax TaxID=13658 RepID=A0A915JKY5_ROMCU